MALVPQTNTIIFVFVRLFPLIDLSYTAASPLPRGERSELWLRVRVKAAYSELAASPPSPFSRSVLPPLKGEGNPFPKKLYN